MIYDITYDIYDLMYVADVGLPKATVLADKFREIVPECAVEAMVEMYDATTTEAILAGNPDYVLDAIDNIDTKV